MAKKLDKKPGAVPENAPVGMFINAQYLKDLSFENPNPLEASLHVYSNKLLTEESDFNFIFLSIQTLLHCGRFRSTRLLE